VEKHFGWTLESEELDQIMEHFPIPDCPALCTLKLDEEVKRLIQQAPHFGIEKALYNVQNQILNLSLACGLIFLTKNLRLHRNK